MAIENGDDVNAYMFGYQDCTQGKINGKLAKDNPSYMKGWTEGKYDGKWATAHNANDVQCVFGAN